MQVLRLLAPGTRSWAPVNELPLRASKFDRILELVEGKDVLDVGCVGGDLDADLRRTSHARLAGRARYCLGIDIEPEGVKRQQQAGYNVILSNAESFDLGRHFDVVVAADVIEHLANPGEFLRQAWQHLTLGGLLCVVTPNAASLNNTLKAVVGVRVSVNPEHTCWYDLTTLCQLLRRFGFDPIEEFWQDYQEHPLVVLALRLRKNLAAHIVVIARKRIEGTRT